MRIPSLARLAFVASMVVSLGATATTAQEPPDAVVAAGTLIREFMGRDIFSVGDFWMRVPKDTDFNRWLSEGAKGEIVITLTTNPSKYADAPNTRILTGTLMHMSAPVFTSVAHDVRGGFPPGNLLTVHDMFLRDEATGSLGPITFESTDYETVEKFNPHDGKTISVVIQLGRTGASVPPDNKPPTRP